MIAISKVAQRASLRGICSAIVHGVSWLRRDPLFAVRQTLTSQVRMRIMSWEGGGLETMSSLKAVSILKLHFRHLRSKSLT